MLGTVLYGLGYVRYEERDEPKILKPTDAIIRIAATCVWRLGPLALSRPPGRRHSPADGA